MTPEGLAALVNTGIGGIIIAVVLIFLNFMSKRDTQMMQFFREMNKENEELKKGVADLTTVTGQLVQEVKEMRAALQSHDQRVDRVEDKIDAIRHPNTTRRT